MDRLQVGIRRGSNRALSKMSEKEILMLVLGMVAILMFVAGFVLAV